MTPELTELHDRLYSYLYDAGKTENFTIMDVMNICDNHMGKNHDLTIKICSQIDALIEKDLILRELGCPSSYKILPF